MKTPIAVVVALAFLLVTLVYCAVADAQANTQPVSLATPSPELLKQIAQLNELLQKNSFKNVAFNFSMVEKIQRKDEKTFKVTHWSNGKMWLSGRPNSLIKVSYFPDTSDWTDGTSPYLQQNKTYAFNGTYWIKLIDSTGPMNSMIPYKVATITQNPPADWKAPRWNTGEMFLLGHTEFFNHLTLEETLGQFSRANNLLGLIHLTREPGVLKILLNFPPNKPTNSSEIWLDLNKGGALQKIITKHYSYTTGEVLSTTENTIEKYENIQGVWFPTKAKRYFNGGDIQITDEFIADHFSIIADSAGLYDAALMPGTQVVDKRTNTSYVVK